MDNTWYEKIEDYLSGAMSSEDRLLFEGELDQNKELSSIFHLYTEIEVQMRNKAPQKKEVALNKTLKTLNETYFFNKEVLSEPQILNAETKKTKGKNHLSVSHHGFLQAQSKRGAGSYLWVKLAAVATFIGIIVYGVIMFYQNNADHEKIIVVNKDQVPQIIDTDVIKDNGNASNTSVEVQNKTLPSNKEILPSAIENNNANTSIKKEVAKKLDNKEVETLFSQYFTADVAPTNLPEYLEEPLNDFENNKYDVAITKLNDILAIVENDDFKTRGQESIDEVDAKFFMHYYLGQSYLALDSTTKAIAELQKAVLTNTSTTQREKASWFLALSFLKINQLQKAIPLLKKIANNKLQNYYQQSAKALLKNL